jgi:peptide deformylase
MGESEGDAGARRQLDDLFEFVADAAKVRHQCVGLCAEFVEQAGVLFVVHLVRQFRGRLAGLVVLSQCTQVLDDMFLIVVTVP